jgi:hypothetical protein
MYLLAVGLYVLLDYHYFWHYFHVTGRQAYAAAIWL